MYIDRNLSMLTRMEKKMRCQILGRTDPWCLAPRDAQCTIMDIVLNTEERPSLSLGRFNFASDGLGVPFP